MFLQKIFMTSFVATCFQLAFMSVAIYTRSSYDLMTPRQPSDYVSLLDSIVDDLVVRVK